MPTPDTHEQGVKDSASAAAASQDINRQSSSSAGTSMESAESHAACPTDMGSCQDACTRSSPTSRLDPSTTAWVNPLASGSYLSRANSQSKAAGLRRDPSLTKVSMSGAEECRICLLSQIETEEQLIHPCGCTGTSSKAHYSCLQTWALEKRSLTCELCKQEYAEPYYSQLKTQLDQHLEQQRVPSFLIVQEGGADAQRDSNEVLDEGIDVGNFVCQVVVVLVLVGVILYLTVFSNIAPSLSSDWTSILWRVLTVLIPGYLIVRMLYGMYSRWMRMHRARRAQALQAAQQGAGTGAAQPEPVREGSAPPEEATAAPADQQTSQQQQQGQLQQAQQLVADAQQVTQQVTQPQEAQQQEPEVGQPAQHLSDSQAVTVVVVQSDGCQQQGSHGDCGTQLQAPGKVVMNAEKQMAKAETLVEDQGGVVSKEASKVTVTSEEQDRVVIHIPALAAGGAAQASGPSSSTPAATHVAAPVA